MPSHDYTPKRAKAKERKIPRWRLPLLGAAVAVCICLLVIPSIGSAPPQPTPNPPAAAATPAPVQPTPTPAPTPTPVPAFDFTRSAPETAAVEMDYFSDALFIGDSRTDGLRLYSGIKDTTFYCYKGLTVFEMGEKKVVDIGGKKVTVLEALAKGEQYQKIYISLGVNELGYFNDTAFSNTFGDFLDQVKALQPDAIIYLENLVPVNPDKCREKKQAYYVNNDRVAAYNAIFPQLAQEKRVVLLDVAAALSDENGILPREATVDGVHFTKDHYKTWLAYLMRHTVDPEQYELGQDTAEGEM